eukprot:3958911-Amphidinium_carterae.1
MGEFPGQHLCGSGQAASCFYLVHHAKVVRGIIVAGCVLATGLARMLIWPWLAMLQSLHQSLLVINIVNDASKVHSHLLLGDGWLRVLAVFPWSC